MIGYSILLFVICVLCFFIRRINISLVTSNAQVEYYIYLVEQYEQENSKLQNMAADALNCDEVRKLQADAMILKSKHEDLIKMYDDLRKAYNQNLFNQN